MREILGTSKTVRELLKGVKYSIDYYQREYKWHEKQIRELVDDLAGQFLDDYDPSHERKKVKDYSRYFLGSIIISRKEIPFKAHSQFKKADIEERGRLYQRIAGRAWNPDDLLAEVGAG